MLKHLTRKKKWTRPEWKPRVASLAPPSQKSRADWFSRSISAIALITSVFGLVLTFWLNYWRNDSLLKLSVISIDESPEGSDDLEKGKERSLTSYYEIALLNDGNRPILVTGISRTIDPISKADTKRVLGVIARDDDYGPDRLTDVSALDAYLRGFEKGLADLNLDCDPNDFEGYAPWKAYKLDGETKPATSIVVKPGEFVKLDRATFQTGWISFQPSKTEFEKAVFYRSCLRIDYAQANGTVGFKTLPVSLLSNILMSGQALRVDEQDEPDTVQGGYVLARGLVELTK